MRIRHNIAGMNAYQNYTRTTSALNRHVERLASGLKINRAADDAAGLAISEKMRFQITGLNQGIKNAKDGISLCQTAEGALQEVHELLRRMKELSIQAANGTYDGLDRSEIQKEINQTISEIDRISEASNFNGKQIFTGGTAAAGSGTTGSGSASGTPETPETPDVPEIDPPEEPGTTTVTCGDFTITTAGKAGIDYTFEDGVLTILSDQAITIRNSDGVSTVADRIVVKKNVNANITLSGVNVASSSGAAFEIEEGSTGDVTVTLEGNNTLKSGASCAGLQKNGDASSGTLTIKGTGRLTAAGGLDAAGIGGGSGKSGSNIIIESGTVNAVGGEESSTSRGGGAGIGGGSGKSGSNIVIHGGEVNATGGREAAGIGGGYQGNGTDITITGGKVNATGGQGGSGAGIGGGWTGDQGVGGLGSNITITGGTVTATAYWGGAGIGGAGGQGRGENITISGGTVTATGGSIGATAIGAGDSGTAGNITITGGTVTANTRSGGYAIGGSGCSGRIDGDVMVRANSSIGSGISRIRGIVFQESTGRIYGSITLNRDFTVNSGEILRIEEGATLTVARDVTLSSSGDIYMFGGTLKNEGTIINDYRFTVYYGTLRNDGTLKNLRSLSVNDSYKRGAYLINNGAIENDGSIYISNSAMIQNLRDIINHGDIENFGHIANEGVVTNFESIINIGDIANEGVIFNYGRITGGGGIHGNGTVQEGGSERSYAAAQLSALSAVRLLAAGETVCGDFTVSGGTLGEDFTFEDGVLKILKDTALTIRNTDSAVATTNRIEVAGGVNADITLAGVNIDVSSTYGKAALEIAENSTGDVTIRLADGTKNTLKSGENCAGLQKSGDVSSGSLTITGNTGTLTAAGGACSAGIGGGFSKKGSNITITGGTVTAIGGTDVFGGAGGAGIGGGYGRDGNNITITGGTVTVQGGAQGAGIGGGYGGDGNDITISGGRVTATGGSDTSNMGGDTGGAGIGGGYGGYGNHITIHDCTVTAQGGAQGAGIGGGYGRSGNDITIHDACVKATGGDGADAIGGGYSWDENNVHIKDSVVFEGNEGKVYGDAALKDDLTVEDDETLEIGEDASLTVEEGASLTNDGEINVDGELNNKGTIVNNGSIHYGGTVNNGGTIKDNGTMDDKDGAGTLNGNPPTTGSGNDDPEPPSGEDDPETAPDSGSASSSGVNRFWIQCGCEDWDGIYIDIEAMDSALLGVRNIDVRTAAEAGKALSRIVDAINKVSSIRGTIGAQQNRLEHTIAHQMNTTENLTAAESLIRDTDVAEEMMELVKVNILAQAGMSMMTQANASHEAALRLLQ